jgi:Arc/MetJ-type ribon-helix-helix transcriptional regulator
MNLTVELSTEVAGFVTAEVARGAAGNEAELVTKAVELYRDFKTRHDELRARVQKSLEQAARGEVRSLDTQATKVEARRRQTQQK